VTAFVILRAMSHNAALMPVTAVCFRAGDWEGGRPTSTNVWKANQISPFFVRMKWTTLPATEYGQYIFFVFL